jgi:hypothetical protein
MRLLPRTPRGTWLLAGLAWAAAWAAVWWALPVQPRVEWQAPWSCELLGFFGDGRTLVTLDSPARDRLGRVRFWDVETGAPQNLLPGGAGESAVAAALTPDGRSVLVTVARNARAVPPEYQVRLYQPGNPDGRVLLTSDRFTLAGTLMLSSDGRALASYASDPTDTRPYQAHLRVGDIWDCERQELVASFPNLVGMTFSPDGRWLAVQFPAPPLRLPGTGQEKLPPGVTLWDVAGRRPAAHTLQSRDAWFLRFVPGSNALVAVATRDQNSTLTIWDTAAGQERVRRAIRGEPVFTPDGADVLVATNDYRPGVGPGPTVPHFLGWGLSRWTWATGEHRYRDVRPGGAGEGAAGPPLVSPDGRVAAVPTSRRWPPDRVRLIGQALKRWTGLDWLDGRTDERTRFVTTEDARSLGTVPTAKQSAFSPDGCLLASLYPDEEQSHWRVVKVWDVPPRTSLSWLLGSAALVALPVAWLARWWTSRSRPREEADRPRGP